MRSFRRAGPLLLLLAVCLPLGVHTSPSATLVGRVQRLLAEQGTPTGPRLSALLAPPAGGGSHADRARAVGVLQREAGARLRRGVDPEALHAQALLELGWPDSAGLSASRAVARLQASLDAGGPSATRLSDLAAAYLVRAERGGGLLDVHYAIEAADRALELDSLHAPARYNLALALDRLMLDGVAARAWARVRALEPHSAWSAEAARRQARLARPAPPWRGTGRSLAAAAAAAPQPARVFAVDTALGRWGSAVLRGDSASAAQWLARADTVGIALRARGGDGTAVEMLASIRRRADDPAALRSLAWAHAAYARAQGRLDVRQGPAALAVLDSIREQLADSLVLARWTTYTRVVALFYSGQIDESIRACEALVEQVDAGRFPVLAARIQWSLGTFAVRRAMYPDARERYGRATRLFERAGERENLGNVQHLEAEALIRLGDVRGGYERLGSALATLRPYRGSIGLHNLLFAAAMDATSRGFPHSARWLHDEDVQVTSTLQSGLHAEALLLRARALASVGEVRRARADVERSRALLDSVSDDYRNWLQEDLLVAQGQLAIAHDPRGAVTQLDSALLLLQARVSHSRRLTALIYRADAHLRAGNEARAVADLELAAATRDSLRPDVQSAAVRAAMAEAGRRVFDRLAMVHVNAGRPREALAALERGRAVFGPRAARASSAALVAPAGEVVLDYALIGDTLLAFAVREGRVHLARSRVDRDGLIGELSGLRAALELRAPAESLLPRLGALYAVLVRPLRAQVPAGTRIVVIADGEIAGAPFAALWDAAARRYLFQDHLLRFSPTFADAVASRNAPAPRAGPAVFVADPAFEPGAYPGLQRLGETEAGVRAAAAAYPGAAVLAGAQARRGAVEAALGRAGLFHFAGHAVFDEDHPADSYLVLAGAPAEGRLAAAKLEGMDLRGLRLVVLSACETQRSASGRSGGFAGLSGALLAAGAGGVVGSLWRVDDDLTRALMNEFHAAYRPSGDGAAALRQAQLRLLASPDPALRSPAAWAGFRYAGG